MTYSYRLAYRVAKTLTLAYGLAALTTGCGESMRPSDPPAPLVFWDADPPPAALSLDFNTRRDYFPTPSGKIVSGDFDRDGNRDVIMGTGPLTLLLGRPDGTFFPARSVPGGPSWSLLAGDLNSDGRLDLVMGGAAAQGIVVLGNGDGTFQPPYNIDMGPGPVGVALGDFNRDGKPDLAVALIGTWSTGGSYVDGNVVSILIGNGDGTYLAPRTLPLTGQPFALAAVDVNGDGKLDLAVAVASKVNILLGRGDGTFGAAADFESGGDSPIPGDRRSERGSQD